MWDFEYVIINSAKQNPLSYAGIEHRWHACHGDQNMSLARKLSKNIFQLNVELKKSLHVKLSLPGIMEGSPEPKKKQKLYARCQDPTSLTLASMMSVDFWKDSYLFHHSATTGPEGSGTEQQTSE